MNETTVIASASTRATSLLLLAIVLVAACESPTAEPGAMDPAPPRGEGPSGEEPLTNPIDHAIWPRFVQAGRTTIPRASENELCRRIALDFAGRTPTREEQASFCRGKSAAEMVDAFLTVPTYIDRERKLWIQHLREDPARLVADDIVDADPILDALATGALGYDDFAARILAHPVGAVNRRIDEPELQYVEDQALFAFRVFLGRTPVGPETVDFSNLFRVWLRDYSSGLPYGFPADVHLARIDPAGCAPFSCTSTLLGEVTTVNVVLPAGSACMQFDALGKSVPRSGACFSDFRGGKTPPEIQKELEKPGRLLAKRREFWDEAADHALTRLLGWWKTSAAEPDTVLPEARAAASAYFRDLPGHDIRQLYKLIATSLLYTTTSATTTETKSDDPPWFSGPLKMMEATQYLDSAASALAIPIGFCDPHTDEAIPGVYFPSRLRKTQPGDFYGFGRDYYFESGRALGGCRGGAPEPTTIDLDALSKTLQVAKTLCTKGMVAPPSFDPADASPRNVDALVVHQFESLLARSPDEEEQKTLGSTASTCLPNASCAMTTFAAEMCGALLRSSAYLYY